MNINDILSSVLQSTNASNTRMAGIADLLGQNAQQAQAVNAETSAGARADIPVAQGLAQQQADVVSQQGTLVQQLQAQANLNPADADNAYVKGLANLTAINAQRDTAHSELTKLSTTNLLDDPIGFVMAQLQMPVAQAQAQALDNEAARQVQDVQTRLSLVHNAKSTLTADTVQQVKEIQLGQAQLAAREAGRKLAQQEVENSGRVAGQLMQQISALDRIHDNTTKVYSMQMQAAQYEATMADRQEARAERQLRFEEMMAAKKAKAGDDAMLTTGLATASTLLGYPQAITIDAFKKMPNGKAKQELFNLAANGSLGDNLFDSVVGFKSANGTIAGLQRGGNIGFAKLMSGLDKTADTYVSAAANTADKLGKKPQPKEAGKLGMEAYERQIVSASADPKTNAPLTSPKWDSEFNPYRQHLGLVNNAVTAGKINLAGNPLYEAMKTIGATSQTPDGNVSGEGEQTALRTVAQMVVDKKLNENDAAKAITQYYRASAAINYDFYQYGLVGLPKQDHYVAKVKIPSMWGDSTTPGRDLMNETQAKMLVMDIAKESARNAPVGTAVMPSGPMLNTPSIFKWAK